MIETVKKKKNAAEEGFALSHWCADTPGPRPFHSWCPTTPTSATTGPVHGGRRNQFEHHRRRHMNHSARPVRRWSIIIKIILYYIGTHKETTKLYKNNNIIIVIVVREFSVRCFLISRDIPQCSCVSFVVNRISAARFSI